MDTIIQDESEQKLQVIKGTGRTADSTFRKVGPIIPAADVHAWFSDAGRSMRLKQPGLPQCRVIADRIADARDNPAPDLLSHDAKKAIRAASRAVRSDRAIPPAPGIPACILKRQIIEVERFEASCEYILAGRRSLIADLACVIADLAFEAWQETGIVPAGRSKTGPIVAFTRAALEALGHDKSEDAVEHMLRL
jgi:hypothetical protein